MTTELIHGAPGSYKTSSLLSLYLYDALKDNRTIITNIRGFSSIEHLNENFFSTPKPSLLSRLLNRPVEPFTPSTSTIITVPHDDDGFAKMARFFHWAPKNALILMDEGQRVYPSRLTKLSEFDNNQPTSDFERPSSVENAFDQHRHFGWDIYISTTNIAKIHKEIRQVAEYAYRHKNLVGITGMKGRYKRVQHDPENNGKSLSHVMTTVYQKMDTRVFSLYQSTVTDKTKDIKSENQLFKSPKFYFVAVLLSLSFFTFIFVFSTRDFPLSVQSSATGSLSPTSVPSGSASVTALPPQKAPSFPSGDASRGLSDQDVYLVNFFDSILYHCSTIDTISNGIPTTNHFFKTQDGYISSSDLSAFGINYQPLSSYFVLSLGSRLRFIPSGNPNPEYYHPDSQPLPTPANVPLSTTSVLPF